MIANMLNAALITAVMLLPSLGGANAQQLTPSYNYRDLGGAPGGAESFANAINDAGGVVGFSYVGENSHATLWNETSSIDLGASAGAGAASEAWAINARGDVAGFTFLGDKAQAASWAGTTLTRLDTPSGADSSYAVGINGRGQVVGWSSTDGNTQAVVWNGATATSLGTLENNPSVAYAINESGQIAGRSTFSGSSTPHAALWNEGSSTPTNLGALPGGDSSVAFAINDQGQVAGRSSFLPGSFDYHATVWNGTIPTDLGTLGGDSSGANAINNSGQVVGWSDTDDGNTSATLWNGTAAVDLNTFLDDDTLNGGWVLTEASDINDHGWIVGDAYNTMTKQAYAFLLTPVPEPEIYSMLLIGLGLMGLISRRKKKLEVFA